MIPQPFTPLSLKFPSQKFRVAFHVVGSSCLNMSIFLRHCAPCSWSSGLIAFGVDSFDLRVGLIICKSGICVKNFRCHGNTLKECLNDRICPYYGMSVYALKTRTSVMNKFWRDRILDKYGVRSDMSQKRGVARPISNIDSFVKHGYREHNQEADYLE